MNEPNGSPEHPHPPEGASSQPALSGEPSEALPPAPARLLAGRRIVLGGEAGEYGRRLLMQLAFPVTTLGLLVLAGLGLERLLPMQSVTTMGAFDGELAWLRTWWAEVGGSAALPAGLAALWWLATWVRVRLQRRTHQMRIAKLPPLVELHRQRPHALSRGLWLTESVRLALHLSLLGLALPVLLVLLRNADQEAMGLSAWAYMGLLLLVVAALLFAETVLVLMNTYVVFRPGRARTALALGCTAVLRSPVAIFRVYWVWASRVLLAFGFSALVMVRILATWTGGTGDDPTWWLSGLLMALCALLAVRYRMLLDRALHLMMGVHFRLLAIRDDSRPSEGAAMTEPVPMAARLPHAPPGWFAGDAAWRPIPLEPILAAARAGAGPRKTVRPAEPQPADEEAQEGGSSVTPVARAADLLSPPLVQHAAPVIRLPNPQDEVRAVPSEERETPVARRSPPTPGAPVAEWTAPAWVEAPLVRVSAAKTPVTRASSGVAEVAWTQGDEERNR